MATVHDVAAYILEKLPESASMTTTKLQKLCYYSQGWSLAWDEEPLFHEKIQAWANGPVVYELFKEHRGRFRVKREDLEEGNANNLTQDQKDTVDAVFDSYGKLSGQQLSDRTHQERPWIEARKGLEPGQSSSTPLSLDTMQDFFGALANS